VWAVALRCIDRIAPEAPIALRFGDTSVVNTHEARAAARLTLTADRYIDISWHGTRLVPGFGDMSAHR
jgi:hypothetical protein